MAEPIEMLFGLWGRMGPWHHVLDGSSQVVSHVSMAISFGTQFATTGFSLSMGYNFGCMIASDTLFDSRGGFSGSSYLMKT